MGKERNEKETPLCPVGKFFMDLERFGGGKSGYRDHLNRSRIEFLKAVRALVDEGIEYLEKKESPSRGKRATRIKVD
ncbi:MAG: hypothetical protein JW821_06470 [Deltaproteobacteria bacterium]|nr:hypothetical protein [Deltaproteobacteria bacterium]